MRAWPPSPLASTSTVSLVDVQPSTVMTLKDASTASRRAACRVTGSTAASVVHSASMVAMFGASMAAPLAMAPTVKPSARTSASLGTVSVVMMARAAAAADSGPPARVPTIRRMFGPTSIDGERDADQPGLADQDLLGPGADAQGGPACTGCVAASRPGSPVAALALPEVRITPATWPAVACR